jgi:hypothetical protein
LIIFYAASPVAGIAAVTQGELGQSIRLEHHGLIRSGGLPVQFVLNVLAGIGKRGDQAAPVFFELTLDQSVSEVAGVLIYENLWACAE